MNFPFGLCVLTCAFKLLVVENFLLQPVTVHLCRALNTERARVFGPILVSLIFTLRCNLGLGSGLLTFDFAATVDVTTEVLAALDLVVDILFPLLGWADSSLWPVVQVR